MLEKNRTHNPGQHKMCFPRPKPEQRALRTPSTAAIIRRGLRAGAEMAFWKSQIWARVGSTRRPGSVCWASRSVSDTVIIVSFDRFHFHGGKGAVERIWRGGREGYGQSQLEMPFPRPEVDLRRTLSRWGRRRYGQKRRPVLILFAPKQSVSIDFLQLNVARGGLNRGKMWKRGLILSKLYGPHEAIR